ncbi:MAG: hypothetical protein ACI8T1_005278, partial [Verrucomicrobiales bacterium]
MDFLGEPGARSYPKRILGDFSFLTSDSDKEIGRISLQTSSQLWWLGDFQSGWHGCPGGEWVSRA